MVKLVPYQQEHFKSLNSFQLDEVQSEFTASFSQNIVERKIESIPGKFPVTILYNEEPVGFFILDNSDEKFVFVENPDEILLRSLSLNPKYQGKGIGKQTMIHLDEFVRNHFPEIKHIVLAVNFRNEIAYNLYLKSGYKNIGNKIFEGIKGPQWVLSKSNDS